MTTILGGIIAHGALVTQQPLVPVSSEEARDAWAESRVSLKGLKRLKKSRLLDAVLPVTRALLGAPSLQKDQIPLNLWVDCVRKSHASKKAEIHARPQQWAGRSLLRLWPEAGEPFSKDGVYIASPELQFLEASRRLGIIELVLLGNWMCGSYELRPDLSWGFLSKETAWTTKASLEAMVAGLGRTRGPRTAREAAPLLTDGCASPEEAALAPILGWMPEFGGYGLDGFSVNPTMSLTEAGRRVYRRTTARPDFFYPASWFDVEYDSGLGHRTPERMASVVKRRSALELSGVKLLPLVPEVLYDKGAMDEFARRLAERLGRSYRAPDLPAQTELRRIGLGTHLFW